MEKQLTTKEIKKIIERCPVSQINEIIDEYIHDARNREITRAKLIDGDPYEQLAALNGLSTRHCFNIVKDCCNIILSHIKT